MSNGFKAEEVVLIQGRPHPCVGGRLRLAHEANDKISIKTELVHFVLGEEAIVRCEVVTGKGAFTATGVATAARDGKLVHALVELAETRSLARSLRWAGYGFELGVEELDAEEQVRPTLASAGTQTGRTETPVSAARQNRTGPPASSAQVRCIRLLARKLGQDADEAVAKFTPGTDIEHLSLAEASRVIDRLRAVAGNGHAEGGR